MLRCTERGCTTLSLKTFKIYEWQKWTQKIMFILITFKIFFVHILTIKIITIDFAVCFFFSLVLPRFARVPTFLMLSIPFEKSFEVILFIFLFKYKIQIVSKFYIRNPFFYAVFVGICFAIKWFVAFCLVYSFKIWM